MKWWVFNEEQLNAALRQYRERERATFPQPIPGSTTEVRVTMPVDDVIGFLYSEEAALVKMRGDK